MRLIADKHYWCCIDDDGRPMEPWRGVLRLQPERCSNLRLPEAHLIRDDKAYGTFTEFKIEIMNLGSPESRVFHETEDEAWTAYIYLLTGLVHNHQRLAQQYLSTLMQVLSRRQSVSHTEVRNEQSQNPVSR